MPLSMLCLDKGSTLSVSCHHLSSAGNFKGELLSLSAKDVTSLGFGDRCGRLGGFLPSFPHIHQKLDVAKHGLQAITGEYPPDQ